MQELTKQVEVSRQYKDDHSVCFCAMRLSPDGSHFGIFFPFLFHSSQTFSLTPLTALMLVCVTLPGFEYSHRTEFSIC